MEKEVVFYNGSLNAEIKRTIQKYSNDFKRELLSKILENSEELFCVFCFDFELSNGMDRVYRYRPMRHGVWYYCGKVTSYQIDDDRVINGEGVGTHSIVVHNDPFYTERKVTVPINKRISEITKEEFERMCELF